MKSKPLDNGNKNFQPSNLEITKIHIDNTADNVIPAKASATFNVRYNNLHTFNSLKKEYQKRLVKSKKFKCKTDVKFISTGTSFITKPIQCKKFKNNSKETKQKAKLSTSGGTPDARFIKDIPMY